MEDTDLMPYGKHKGTAMANIPAADLIWLYENNRTSKDVRQYIEENMDVLKEEIKQANNKKK